MNRKMTSRKKTLAIHDRVVEIVFDLVRSAKNTYSEKNVFMKKAIPELENQDTSYEPDVWAIATRTRTKRGQTDIFEVWHTQAWEKGFTDLINSVLIEDLGHIHIALLKREQAFDDPWTKEYAKMIKKALSKILNFQGKKRLESLALVEIDDDDLKPRNRRKLRTKIKKRFDLY
jgi:hypothetical protein